MFKKRAIAMILTVLILFSTVSYAASSAVTMANDAAPLFTESAPPPAQALSQTDPEAEPAADVSTPDAPQQAPAGSEAPPPADGDAPALPEDDEEPEQPPEPRTAPTATLPAGAETLTMFSDETKTVQVTVTDEVDAPEALNAAVQCSNEALFDPQTILAESTNGVYTLYFAPLGTGTATVSFTATNTAGLSATVSIAVTVAQSNRAPVFTPPAQALAVAEDSSTSFDLSTYFTDPDGDALSYEVTTAPQHGSAVIAGAQLSYTPDANYDQSDSFTITASDGALTADGSFEVSITPEEDAPISVDDTAACTTAGGSISIDVLANDTVVDSGATLEITGLSQPPAGQGTAALVEEAGRQLIRYTPNPRQGDGLVQFSYTVIHAGGSLAATGTVNVTVSRTNNAPVISGLASALNGTEDGVLEFSFTVSDADVDTPPDTHLTLSIDSDNTDILKPAGISWVAEAQDDDTVLYTVQLTFEHYANTSAEDGYGSLTLTVRASDGEAAHDAVQTLAVHIAPVDNAPVIRNAPTSIAFDEDSSTSFTFDVYDPDIPLAAGDPGYTVSVLSDTAAVLPNLAANIQVDFVSKTGRTATYRVTLTPLPNANTHQAAYSLQDVQLSLAATDPGGNTAGGSVAVDVRQVNDAPTAKDLAYTVDEDTEISIAVADAGSDIDGVETILFHAGGTMATSAQGGTISLSNDGKTLTYTPKQYYYGSDSFNYQIIDTEGATSEVRTVSITLNFINYPPTFTNLQSQPYETDENQTAVIELTVFDVETPAETVGLQVSVSANSDLIASYSLDAVDESTPGKRVLRITPAENRNSYGGRNAQFKLVLGDGTVYATFHLALKINPVNNAPKAGALEMSFDEDVPVTVYGSELLKVCSDVDIQLGEPDVICIKAASLGTPVGDVIPTANGSIGSILADEAGNLISFVYTPNPYFDGEEVIHFKVQDSGLLEAAGTLKLKARPVNNAPVLDEIADVTLDEDQTTNNSIDITFFDPETDRDKLILAVNSGNESVLNKDSFGLVLTSTGCVLTITPRPEQFDEDGVEVRFTVSDGENSVSRTFKVVVRSVPDAPHTPDLDYTVRDATTLLLDPLAECADPDPDDEMTLTLMDPQTALSGTLEELGNGQWAYTSEPGFEGTVVLEYTVEDLYNLTSTGTITITVGNTDIGASIKKLPSLIFFSGQTVPTYTLTIEGLNAGREYYLTAEVVGGTGPVDTGSLNLDGGGASLHVGSAAASPQTHTLSFGLSRGIIGDSVVRVVITYKTEDGQWEEGVMSFKVTATQDNEAPTTRQHPPVECNEGSTVDIDVLSYVDDREDPLRLQLQIQKASNPSNGSVSIVQVDGRWMLRFHSSTTLNAHASPHTSSVSYTVVDSGGKTVTGSVDVRIKSQNHRPYTTSYMKTVTLAEATGGTLVDPRGSARDYDGDALVLHSVTNPDSGGQPGACTAVITDDGGGTLQLLFTAGTPGWYTLEYQVTSSFDGINWDISYPSGNINGAGSPLLIGVQDEHGKIPPRFRNHTIYRNEDSAEYTYEITGHVFASANNDVTLTLDTGASNTNGKLESYSVWRTDKDGVADGPGGGPWTYWLTVKPAPNANSGTAGGSPQVQFSVLDNETGQTADAPGIVTVHLYAVNDAPEMQVLGLAPATAVNPDDGAQFQMTVQRGIDTTFQIKVTDIDFETQTDCDKQIKVSLLSSNDIYVNSEMCAITAPGSVPGVWDITIRGLNEGTCTLTLTGTDGNGASCTGVVRVRVTAQNTLPTAKDHYAVFSEDTKAAVTAYDEHSDPEGDPLSIELITTNGAHLPGRVAVEGNKITFMPSADFCHSQSYADTSGASAWPSEEYVEIEYALWDGAMDEHNDKVLSAPAFVRIHFNPENDAPRFVALNPNHSMDEGKTGIIKLRVTDVDSQTLDFDWDWQTDDGKIDDVVLKAMKTSTGTSGCTYEVTLSVTNILYQYHKSSEAPTRITVRASDADNAEATANLLLTINPSNDAPLLKTGEEQPLPLEVDEDDTLPVDLVSHYWDPDEDVLNIMALTNAVNGSVRYNPTDGYAYFTPTADYFAVDASNDDHYGWFDYVITDGSTGEVRGQAKILIKPVNDPPRLKNASRTTAEDTPLEIDLWSASYNKDATIWDVDDDEDNLKIALVGTAESAGTDGKTAKGGTVQVDAAGRLITYTPAEDFFGPDSFRYYVEDAAGARSWQTVVVTVTPVDDAPRANFEGSATWANSPKVEVKPEDIPSPCWVFDEDETGSFSFRVWDPEGNTVLVTYETDAPASFLPLSRITLSGSGENLKLNMMPLQDQFGTFNVTFTLDDGAQKQTYTIPVEVLPVNDLPKISNTAFEVDEDKAYAALITASDVEDPASALVFSLADDVQHPLPQHGTAEVDADGSYRYTPNANYFGPDVFYICVTDLEGGASWAKMSVTVKPVNDAPSAASGLSFNKSHYADGEATVLSWTAGEDLQYETPRDALLYEIQLSTNGGTSWQTVASRATGAQVNYTGGACSYAVPGSFLVGVSSAGVLARVRCWDDGKSYLWTDGSLLASLTPLPAAAWAQAGPVKADSAKPRASHTLAPNSWANDPEVLITLAPADDDPAEDWQSGFDYMVAPAGISVVDAASHQYKTAANGVFVFQLYDKVGNRTDYTVTVGILDRIAPAITASPASISASAVVGDDIEIALTYTDPADISLPANGGDAASGLVLKQYKLVRNGAEPGEWTNHSGSAIALDLKGSYVIMARAEDAAGNTYSTSFGPYVVNNSAPAAEDKSVSIYRVDVAGSPTKTKLAALELEAADDDVEDTLSYHWVTNDGDKDADYIDLTTNYADLNGSGTSWTLEYKTNASLPPDDLSSKSFTLYYYAKDDDAVDAKQSALAEVTVTLHPVNHVPGAPPNTLAPAATALKGGASFTLDWDDGNDTETAAAALRYQVRWRSAPDGAWSTPAVTAAGETEYTLALPALNTDHFEFEVRTLDDNPASRINPDGSFGPALSAAVLSPVYTLDSQSPVISFAQTPANGTWTNASVPVTVTITDKDAGTVRGQAGLAEVWAGGASVQTYPTPGTETYTDATLQATNNGTSFTYKAIDHVGNESSKTHTVSNIDRLPPAVTADLPSGTQPGYAKTPIKVNLSYNDAPATATDGQSGVNAAQKWVRCVSAGSLPALTDMTGYSLCSGEITFNVRGTYYIDAWCRDNATNDSEVKRFGPYEIANSAPVAQNVTATLYEHNVADVPGAASSVDIVLNASDADGDGMSYSFAAGTDATLAALGMTLVQKAGKTWTLTHDGREFTSSEIILKYTATDDFVADIQTSAEALVTVTLVPVNDAPAAPAGFAIASPQTHYAGGQKITLNWTAGSDDETATGNLVYVLRWPNTGKSGGWDSQTTAAGATTAEVTIPAGTNSAAFEVQIQTQDDNPGTVYNPDGSQGPAVSAAVKIENLKVDSAAPTATHTLAQTGWANTSTMGITLAPADNTPDAAWQSGFASITPPAGVTTVNTASHEYSVAANGSYVFVLRDHVGNQTNYTVTVDKLDRIAPTITPSPASIAAGAVVDDAIKITLSYSDPADSSPPASGGDAASGLVLKQYKLVRDAANAGQIAWTNYADGAQIALNLKGSYVILAQAEDTAGNTFSTSFGPYVIHNTPPTAEDISYTVYEHTVAAANVLHTAAIQMAGSDDDTEDSLSYAWVIDAEYNRLMNTWGTMSLSGAAGSGSYTFAHNGSEVETLAAAQRVFNLKYKATDSAGAESAAATVAITLVPVNHRPDVPGSLAAAAGLYEADLFRQGDSVALSWSAGSDTETTNPSDLTYDVEYTLDAGTGAAWTALSGSPFSGTGASATAPAGSSGSYRFRTRTRDANPASTGAMDEVSGEKVTGVSAWVESPAYRLDNTPPTATHSIAPAASEGGDLIVVITPADGSEAWQSGVNRVQHPTVPGLAVEPGPGYRYRISQDGSYAFKIYDVAGNETTYNVGTSVPADPQISYSTTHTSRGRQIAVSWTHATSTAHYELQVYNGNSWATVLAESANHTAKTHTYTVPATFPDTAAMCFRVRAWDGGLHSANWAMGTGIICDSTKPVITLTPAVAGSVYTNQSYAVAVAVTDNLAKLAEVTVQKNGTGSPVFLNPAQASYNLSVAFDENGSLSVTTADACGNVATASYAPANIDKVPPVANALVYSNGVPYTGRSSHPLAFAISFSDAGVSGLAERAYAITNSAAMPASWTQVAGTSASETRTELGQYHLHLRAADGAGNITYLYAGMFEVYNTIPVALPQTVQVDEGAAVDITLQVEENDPGDYMTKWELITEPLYGSLSHLGGGMFRYVHDGIDPIANDFFTFRVEDTRQGVSNVARVDIVVLEVNDPPFIHDLPTSLDIPWNTTTAVSFSIADADDLSATLSWKVRSDKLAVLPLNGVNISVLPRAGGYEADVVMNLTPVQGAFTEDGSPVMLTIRLRDKAGLQDEKVVWVNVLRTAQPPKAQDQYHFVLPGGTVRGTVRATPDHESVIAGYTFGTPADGSQCSLATAADGSFSFTAQADFISDAFPVRVHDANGLCTDITVYVSGQAISQESVAVDRLVSSIPALAGVDPAGATVSVESSSHPGILPVENCDFILGAGGELQLYYNPVEHRYGQLTLTLSVRLPDGTVHTLAIPIVVEPINDAPEVALKTKSPLNDGVYDVYIDESMAATLQPDDSLDDDYRCTSFAFSCEPGHAPEFGSLEIAADGGFTYTPDAGFKGEDEFCITVGEQQGWAANKNPAQLPCGVIDVSNGVPLLARVVHVRVNVGKRPKETPPQKPEKEPPVDVPAPAPGGEDPGAPQAPENTTGGTWAPSPETAPDGIDSIDSAAQAPPGTGEDKPETPAASQANTPAQPQTPQAPPAGSVGWLWAFIGGGGGLVMLFLLLLFGCRIRISYMWRDANGKARTKKRTLWFRRIRHADEDARRLNISARGVGALGSMAFRLKFGPLYRRRFYGEEILLVFDTHEHLAGIPEKDGYRQNGVTARGTDFE